MIQQIQNFGPTSILAGVSSRIITPTKGKNEPYEASMPTVEGDLDKLVFKAEIRLNKLKLERPVSCRHICPIGPISPIGPTTYSPFCPIGPMLRANEQLALVGDK